MTHAWVALNARAFAEHPEQGSWTTSDDLRTERQQAWFDPGGFFVARRGRRMVGFHWTKVRATTPTGEVYVVGADPDGAVEQVWARALTLVGLHHLRDAGSAGPSSTSTRTTRQRCASIRALGFERVAADVMYARPAN